jgi:ubiquinone/menaquinone biosynthesis C-methylase UbiE
MRQRKSSAEMRFINYGYQDDAQLLSPIKLDECDIGDRLWIQLYDHVATLADIAGKEILDIGSGKGGGSYYVAKYLNPLKVTGLDLSQSAIMFCEKNYGLSNLVFVCGDAEDTKFPESSFDSILNVESSHCYESMPRFLKGVERILKPGGFLHFADLRPSIELLSLEEQLLGSGLTLIKKKDISPNVLRALTIDHERKMEWIQECTPQALRSILLDYAGTKGSKLYNLLENRQIVYLSYLLQKNPGQ